MRPSDLEQILVSSACSLRDAVQRIDRSGLGIALVVDPTGRLLATVTDGDVRRAILAAIDLDAPVQALLGRSERPSPLTAPAGTAPETAIRLMHEAGVRHLPLVDEGGRVVDLLRLGDVEPDLVAPVTAVVMAGGFGTRLRPLTDETPKPLLPVGDKPLLHLILDQLREAGVRKVRVTTHYRAEQIAQYLGNGDAFGLEVRCIAEEQPLGTAGSLGLVDAAEEPLLVINGDILTRLDFRKFVAFHLEHAAAMTVAVRRYEFEVPYGVVETDGVDVLAISEKPTLRVFVNAGMYLVDPRLRGLLPPRERCDMPDLIRLAVAAGQRVVTFPLHEYWLDVGKHGDYAQAQDDVQSGRFSQ